MRARHQQSNIKPLATALMLALLSLAASLVAVGWLPVLPEALASNSRSTQAVQWQEYISLHESWYWPALSDPSTTSCRH